ncbi:SDR family oxidoreductase [Streptomyces aidingensis]|uniref:NAD(P)-dependent dehydrogenase, short-chain alcohol dehydrogenase family n=1 Tax=Streptomyces aidingensis TaxID=910347 RepID=A0A1I1PGY7_9ACTN|nr:SDR family oxidoreductase [Streptomyces aidingensis]SFD09071.1 NAD(P)-dependent dehydrogenase, short-chain alcohol dehydrogenase family [Streptomyces aidingensis]
MTESPESPESPENPASTGRSGSAGSSGGTGRVALVTGGSRGIGYGIAEALIARGDRVCITGRNEESLREAVDRLGADRAMGVAGRAHDEDHQAAVVDAVMARHGRIDYLINNAGTNPVYAPLAELDLAAVRKIYETNVVAALAFVQRVWAAWQRDNGGAVINIASVSGLGASPYIGAYGMSKAAMINLTQQLAHELAPRVRVNALAPAVVKTRFAAALYEGREESVVRRYPLGRLGTPQDIGAAAAFLTSAEAGWITGQTLVLDGGHLLGAGLG